ncbi:MAG: DUF1559 domain-containing protein, partial [Planctomycetota bacterium]
WPDLDTFFFGRAFRDGVLPPGDGVRLGEVTDGTSHTLAIGERAYLTGYHQWVVGAVWNGKAATPNKRRRVEEISLHAVKNVRYPINGPPARFGYFRGDPNMPPGAVNTLLPNDFYFGSHHPGGANFASCDGGVRFVADDADLAVLRASATRAGGDASF